MSVQWAYTVFMTFVRTCALWLGSMGLHLWRRANDDLPDNLLPRIDKILNAVDAAKAAGVLQQPLVITLRQALSLVGFFGGHDISMSIQPSGAVSFEPKQITARSIMAPTP